MTRDTIGRMLTGAAELGSIGVFIVMILVWADAVSVI